MNRKFMIYAIVVTVLTTGAAWQKVLGSQTNSQFRWGGSSGGGSIWSSSMGSGSWAGGSGGHK